MKSKLNKFVLLLVAIFVLGGCSEEFLDEPAPADQVTEDVIFNSRSGVEAYISGIHRRARSQFGSSTDAGGLYSMYFARSVKGNDLINSPNWFRFDYDQDNREPTYRRTVFTWQFSYFMINQANTLINGIEASETLTDEEKADLKGQGLALRAFYYFQLAMEFQHTYTYDPSLPAPPIYTELSLEGHPMSTLEEMYGLIVADLEEAVQGLTVSRLDKSYINVNVAHGILARVYQVMENWEGAEENARAAYGGNVQSALAAPADLEEITDPEVAITHQYTNGFDDISASEWMWGMPQFADQTSYYWAAPHSFADHEGAYQSLYVNPNFVDEFSDTDVRKLFHQRYEDTEGTWQEYVTTKFDFIQEAGLTADIPIMRTPEMILIEAEALYHQGQEEESLELLYALQVNRDPLAVRSGNTGTLLLDEILLERRKELYAEIGVEWFDAKRLQLGIVRDPIHRIVKHLEPNDPRFFLKIPQAEIDANEAINASVNANR